MLTFRKKIVNMHLLEMAPVALRILERVTTTGVTRKLGRCAVDIWRNYAALSKGLR